ncbi:HPP family-domain-containing protein [Amylocarpus encephaloides]|uniref:HPP family-domain-containing protein n=1 Tax=Amylocarpus encephaloides TaxID=45428 RepID=A0A9P8C8V2_9HELO|nr:HPP family-domain-containing protein [Amylocarpus encephaloides]
MNRPSLNFDVDRYINRITPRSRLYLLPKPLAWLLGHREKPVGQIGNVLVWFWAFLGAFVGLLVIMAVFQMEALQSKGSPIVIASLGAAAILEYQTIDSPLAQPRNAILGQLFAAFIGVGITKLFQFNSNFESLRWIAGALAVGLSSAFMGFTKTIHPPAGATALLAATTPEITILGWFLIPLILLGSVLMVATACIFNNIQRQFPIYWWTPMDLTSAKTSDIERVDEAKMAGGSDSQRPIVYEYENHKMPYITIDSERVVIPDWISLGPEEMGILEILRAKLQEGSRTLSTSSQATDQTV